MNYRFIFGFGSWPNRAADSHPEVHRKNCGNNLKKKYGIENVKKIKNEVFKTIKK